MRERPGARNKEGSRPGNLAGRKLELKRSADANDSGLVHILLKSCSVHQLDLIRYILRV